MDEAMDLKAIRAELDIPIGQAADAIGIHKSALWRIEERLREPSGAIMLSIDLWLARLRLERNLPDRYRADWMYLLKNLKARRRRARKRRRAAA